LLHAIYHLEPREHPAALEQMDPLTRGALFHEVQFELCRELQQNPPEPVLEIADRVLDRVAAKYEDDLAPAIPRVWKAEVEELRADLRGWILRFAQDQPAWEPVAFEYGFGLASAAGRDPDSSPEPAVVLDGIRLRGSMDLVERRRDRKALRITDHKTGRPPERRPRFVGGGAVLQPLLYSLSAEQLFGEPVESSRLFYCTERGGYSEIDIPLNQEARAHIRHVLDTIDRALEQGFLPAAPQRDACLTCDYTMVCGPYEQQRVGKKVRDRLEALVDLRSLP
jgi:CRISPR/Cas system-associated exonuclease Cas4 (RecB family)